MSAKGRLRRRRAWAFVWGGMLAVASAAAGAHGVQVGKYRVAEMDFTALVSTVQTIVQKPGFRHPIEKTEFVSDLDPSVVCIYVRERSEVGGLSCFQRTGPTSVPTEPPPVAVANKAD